MNNLCNLIKEYRKLRGFTQQKVAESIGVSRVFYNGLETGNRLPSFETLKNISTTLEVDIEFVFYDQLIKEKAP